MFGKRGKYGSVRTAGFDSRKEKRRHDELMIMQRAGAIRNLKCQVIFPLYTVGPSGSTVPIKYDSNRAMTYRADFTYEEKVGDRWVGVIEDVKGYDTRVSKMKRAILSSQSGIRVRLT